MVPTVSLASALGLDFCKHEPPGISERRKPPGGVSDTGDVDLSANVHPWVVASVAQGCRPYKRGVLALGELRLSNHARGMTSTSLEPDCRWSDRRDLLACDPRYSQSDEELAHCALFR